MFNAELSRRAIEAFSVKTEIEKALEELEELKKELEKFRNQGNFDTFGECKKHYGNLILEMADVEIVLSHLWTITGNPCVFMGAIAEKTEKLRKMLAEAENKRKKKKEKK